MAPASGPRLCPTCAHLHSLGLDPHHAAALVLDLDVLGYHTLLRRHYLLCQDTQDLVLPLQHLLQHRAFQIERSEKESNGMSGLGPRETGAV